MSRAPLLLAGLVSTAAAAWPVDASVDVAPGGEKFVRVGDAAWIDVVDPSVVEAELFPSGELMLTPKREGETLVGVHAQGAFRVLRVRVRKPGAAPAPPSIDGAKKAASAACPGLEVTPSTVEAKVRDGRCRAALLALLREGPWLAGAVTLEFEVAALQDQLAALSRALGPNVRAYYRGAGLVLEGTADGAEHRRVLWAVFRGSAGRLALEDRLTVPADAGTAD